MRSTMTTQAGRASELMNCSVTMPVTESNRFWSNNFFANDCIGCGDISKRQLLIRRRHLIIPTRFEDADCDDVGDVERKRTHGDATQNA